MSVEEQFCDFGPFRLDVTERVLLREGKPVQLTLKAFDTLLVLVERRGHIVEREELMKTVWPDSFGGWEPDRYDFGVAEGLGRR